MIIPLKIEPSIDLDKVTNIDDKKRFMKNIEAIENSKGKDYLDIPEKNGLNWIRSVYESLHQSKKNLLNQLI